LWCDKAGQRDGRRMIGTKRRQGV